MPAAAIDSVHDVHEATIHLPGLGPRQMPSHEITLEQLLEARDADVVPAKSSAGDRALAAGRYADAAAVYASQNQPNKSCRAKHGFALAMLGENAQAIELLNRDNVGRHPEAQAVLAWALMYGSDDPWGRTHPQRDSCRDLLLAVQAHPRPTAIAFDVLLRLWFQVGMGSRPLAEAERAVATYPQHTRLVAILARERRVARVADAATIELLRPLLDEPVAGILEEALQTSMALGEREDADAVLTRLRRCAMTLDARWAQNLDNLAAYTELCLARAGDPRAASRGWLLVAPHLTASKTADERSTFGRVDTCRLAICLAAEMDDEAAMKKAVSRLFDVAYEPESDTGLPDVAFFRVDLEGYDESFGIEVDMPWVEYDSKIRTRLDTGDQVHWSLLVACAAVFCGTDTQAHRDTIVSEGPHRGPLGQSSTMFGVLNDAEPFPAYEQGVLLARACCAAEDGHPALLDALKYFTESMEAWEDADLARVFEAALDTVEEREIGTGEAILDAFGTVLAARASALLPRLGAWVQQRTGKTPTLPAPPDPLQAYLARLPGPETCPTDPAQLSLLEAAALIALLRADMDHARWTLAPLERLAQPFEPHAPQLGARKFIPVLFDLLAKGVVGIAPTTPAGALKIKDGKVVAFLDQIVWSVSPATLALYRAIRDLPRHRWPAAWIEQAPVLARDLGAQELLVYLMHLCEERRLQLPDADVVMPHLKALLEQRSIAHGYYIAHKTAKEAADHYAKYRPNPQALITRMHNLLRGNIEKTLTAGWDTTYNREKDLPESLLFAALHSTLTRWGDRAFREAVYTLPLM